ncbi:MAG TPA: VWA domain-containing protein [Terriglobales bacterium]|nr:VWA domain-containing protein [Terriglobales bacterium]
MATKTSAVLILGLTLLLAGALAAQQKPEDIPDAPSATRPIPPPATPSPRPGAEEETLPDVPPADASGAGVTTGSKEMPRSAPDSASEKVGEKADQKPAPPPMPPVRTIPAGSVPRDSETGDDLYKITVTTNLVLVPVTVTDSQGRLVGGLLPKDFSVLESGQKQTLKFFTSDPFPLSAAVIFDTGMPDVGLKKVQETLSALQGAFSQFDEVGIYTYSSTVGRVADFTAVGKQLTATLNQVKGYSGANNGPPVTSGPLGPQGPYINGHPLDIPVQPVSTPPKVARVMNDAILLAARDLSKRDRTRRKIIFVISDGREQGSTASYADTLKVLLTQNIAVYAVGVEGAAIPIYDRLQRIHLPKTGALMGYSNILPKYVNATGGGTMYAELAQADIERAYARAIGDARNQYTLGYSPKSGIGGYREIEVQVRRPDVKVYAKHGYYPLPTAR